MLKKDTLSILDELMGIGITEFEITGDPNPVHGNENWEYMIDIKEGLVQMKLVMILKILEKYKNVRIEVRADDGLRMYEIESEG